MRDPKSNLLHGGVGRRGLTHDRADHSIIRTTITLRWLVRSQALGFDWFSILNVGPPLAATGALLFSNFPLLFPPILDIADKWTDYENKIPIKCFATSTVTLIQ